MPTLVSTGQITIVDNNDAKPITAYMTATPGVQQVFSKDESTQSYMPDWTTANASTGLLLTPKVYIGGTTSATEISGLMSNRSFSMDMATPITGTAALISSNASLSGAFEQGAGKTFTVVHNSAGSSIKIKANLLEAVNQAVIYFEGDYTDPITGLVSHVIAQISLGMVKTGTNAVYVLTRGNTTIEESTSATKNVAVVVADLIRAAGVDTTGITYRFFEANGATQIDSTMATKYGMKAVAPGADPVGIPGDIGVGLPAAGTWSANNTLVIHETAVVDMGVFRVEAKDSLGTVYQAYFTVYDISDPYDLRLTSTSGDKLQNGIGSTNISPTVFYGATQVASLVGWTFSWYFYNKDGKRGAFIDTTRTAVAGGRTITAHTTGVSAVLTYDGAAITFAAGDIIKVVTPGGADRFYEVASATGNTVTIRTPVTNTWLTYTDFPAPTASAFVNGALYVCTANGTRVTSAGAAITVTGDEIDAKGRIFCEANRP